MGLTAVQPHSEPKATPRYTDWCELGRHSAWHSVVPFHKRMRNITVLNHISEQNSNRWCPAASLVDNELRPWGSSKSTAVSRSGGPVSYGSSPKVALVRVRHGRAAEVLANRYLVSSTCLDHRQDDATRGVSVVKITNDLKIPIPDYLCSTLPRLANFPINRIAELTPSAWLARN